MAVWIYLLGFGGAGIWGLMERGFELGRGGETFVGKVSGYREWQRRGWA